MYAGRSAGIVSKSKLTLSLEIDWTRSSSLKASNRINFKDNGEGFDGVERSIICDVLLVISFLHQFLAPYQPVRPLRNRRSS